MAIRKRNVLLSQIGGATLTKAENTLGVDVRRKRTPEQREADLALVAKLLIRENLTQQEIADRIAQSRDYTLSQITIGADIKELLKRWRDAYLDDIDVLKGRELQRIDQLESAYWDSYERSLKGINEFKEDVTEFTSEDDKIDMIGVEDSVTPSTRRKKFVSRKFQNERDGEAKFLNGIQWCIDKRCEILGLNAPVKSEMTFDWRSEAEKQGIDTSVMYNDLVKKFIDGNIVE
jgi:hypothetical protein